MLALSQSRNSHVTDANAAASVVLRKASAAIPSTLSSLPALKPYQPNHSRPAPSAINGMLCGES
jgi:hypothetical protein